MSTPIDDQMPALIDDEPQEDSSFEYPTELKRLSELAKAKQVYKHPSPARLRYLDLQRRCGKFQARFDHLINGDCETFNDLVTLYKCAFPSSRSKSEILELIDTIDEQDMEKLILYRGRYLEIGFKQDHNTSDFDQIIKVILANL